MFESMNGRMDIRTDRCRLEHYIVSLRLRSAFNNNNKKSYNNNDNNNLILRRS